VFGSLPDQFTFWEPALSSLVVFTQPIASEFAAQPHAHREVGWRDRRLAAEIATLFGPPKRLWKPRVYRCESLR
jgi:hypothetical protein